MLFNTLVFAVFFALVWPAWWLLPPRLRRVWMLAASMVFYGWWDWRFLGLFLLTGLIDYGVALGFDRVPVRARKGLLWLSVCANLGILGTFKYLGFFVQEADLALRALGLPMSLPSLELVLPVGLSFYTFQSMSYTIDVYRGARPTRNLVDFLCFLAFFPQLVAGPIERSDRLLPQIAAPRRPGPTELHHGLLLFTWGLFKKVVVADNLAPLVERAFDQPDPSGLTVLLGAYAFTWQIYCDFSGYSDMARGLARWFGVELMVNFARPFFADGPRDLWRRWHISLSQWLRDYLYTPLGGNRQGPLRTARNLLLTMLLGGLWHGANWTFLAWGGLHGLALVLGRAIPLRLPRPLAILATFHLTAGAFVLFRAHDLAQVGALARRVAQDLAQGPSVSAAEEAALRLFLGLVALVMAWELVEERTGDPLWPRRLPRPLQLFGLVVAGLAILVLGGSYGRPFLYFQF